jgi:biotin-(acetyl-CoA carboxylase) ligase
MGEHSGPAAQGPGAAEAGGVTVPPQTPPAGSTPGPKANALAVPAMGSETFERFGRPMRRYPVAVSTEAMALAWANKEDAPQGATVVVDHEIRPGGLHGRLWQVASTDTMACSVVLRPVLPAEEGDSAWLLTALAAAEGAQAASGRELATWWPDTIVDAASREVVSAVRAEVQLGPGRVKSVIATMRFDLTRLGLGVEGKDGLLESVVQAVDAAMDTLADGAAGVAAAYEKRCGLLGNRVMIRLFPKGETRGTARAVDRVARLAVESASGMVEKVGVDQVRDLKVV